MNASARTAPASLQASVDAETPYGGVDRSWTEVSTLWVALTIGAPADALDGAVSSPAHADSASAVARDHPAAAPGLRLVVAGDPDPWRIRRVDRGVPRAGCMNLRLDRLI